jgi:Glycosyl hydrolase family 12
VLLRWRAAMIMVATVAVLTPQAEVQAMPAGGTGGHDTTVLCVPFQHITTFGRGGSRYVVRNDNFGLRTECLRNKHGWPNFSVIKSSANAHGAESLAYPDIFRGCAWGVCSPNGHMPLRVSRLRGISTTWYTSLRAAGRWAAAYDIWFARRPVTTGQDDGAELMIWTATRHFPLTRHAAVVVVDGARWRLLHWVVVRGGTRWNYIQFRRLPATSQVRKLQLVSFFEIALKHHWIKRSWWLTSVEAGFEIWRGGVGLATRQFWVSAPRLAGYGRHRPGGR